jgi:long-chain fatty acid transport protein
MRSLKRTATAGLLATSVLALSAPAVATNGYFTHGVGTESKAMAGTGVGSNENVGAISIASNPALGVFSDDKWQVGMSIFSPMRSYKTSGGFGGQQGAFTLSNGSYDSDNEAFPIPYVAKNWKLANDNAITFVFYGRGGMNTEWNGSQTATFDPTGQGGAPATLPGLYGAGKAGVDLSQAFLSINYAGKIGDRFAWGIGPVVAFQVFEANGVANFTPYTETFASAFLGNGVGAPASNLTNNGHDSSVGYGFAAGFWTGNDKVSFGLAYQSKVSMDEFSDYSDLFAEGGGFDIPSALKAGLSVRAADAATVNFDIEHIFYSDADSVHNPIMNLLTGCFTANPAVAPATNGCLGGPNGAGFGWDDMTVFKIGVALDGGDRSTWRFGYSYGEQPIPNTEMLFNILAPGVMEQHLTFGWTGERDNGNVMSFSLMYAPKSEITGFSTFDPLQQITLEMTQLEFEFAYRF